MNPIELKLEDDQRGAFVIEENGERLAEMEMSISGDSLVVYHTEVSEVLRGQGIAGKLLDAMVEYARENHMKVIPLCEYVNAQFKCQPAQYSDVWNENWKQ